MDEEDRAWKKKKINDLPISLEKLTIDQNKKCDKHACKCIQTSSSSYPVRKCTHFKPHHHVLLNKKYKKDLCAVSNAASHASSKHKRPLVHSPKLKLKVSFDAASAVPDCGSQTQKSNSSNIFGTKSEMYESSGLESFSSCCSSNRTNALCDNVDAEARYRDEIFKVARAPLPVSCQPSPATIRLPLPHDEDSQQLPDPCQLLQNISSISLQDTATSSVPPSACLATSSSVPSKPAPGNTQPCSVQARISYDDTSMSELASYFDVYCHIPKKMSHMAEMMYI